MSIPIQDLFRLGVGETQDVRFDQLQQNVQTLSPGTYTRKMLIQGNSMLSSVFVAAVTGSATLKVNYFEVTNGEELGERQDIPSHDLISAAAVAGNRIVVTPFHNMPRCEVVIAGTGTVTFSIRVTVVDTFAANLEAALVTEGDPIVVGTNLGLPIICRNPITGLAEFVQCPLPVAVEDSGSPFNLDGVSTSTPGVEQTLGTFTVPLATTRRLQNLYVSSRQPGFFDLKATGVTIASGHIGPGHPQVNFKWIPKRPIATGTTVDLKYTQLANTPPSCVTHHLMASDI